MKLAFSGQAKYPEMTDGYELYVRRARTGIPVDLHIYTSIVKEYCRLLAEDLTNDGIVDLPCGLGSVAAVIMRRRPQYRGKKFVGYGNYDWKNGHYDGEPKAFGLAFLPSRERTHNLRCYGFVANRKLFKKMKELHQSYDCPWAPMEYGKEMI